MSVSVHSPLSSDVFSSLDSLSPPPTPIARRSRVFFPSDPAPMFFPKSQSILGPSTRHPHSSDVPSGDEGDLERRQIASLASRPVPVLRLRPIILVSKANKVALRELRADQFPPLPFSGAEAPFESNAPAAPQLPPSLVSSKGSDPSSSISKSASKKSEAVRPNQQTKLPAFQRSGMKPRTLKKQNSLAARSA